MDLSTNSEPSQEHDTPSPLPSISLTLTFFTINLLLLTWYIIIYPYFYSPLRHLPRPKNEIPLLGQFTTPYTKPLGATYLTWMTQIPNKGLITYRSFLNQDRLLLTTPKAIAEVLVHNPYAYTKHPSERSVIRRFLGDGLTISEGEEHRFQRRLMSLVYTARAVKSFYGMFWRRGVYLTDILERRLALTRTAGGNKVCGIEEMNQWANRTTMDIIGLAALGKDFGCLDGARNELFEAYQEIFTWAPEKDVFLALNRLLPRGLVSWLPWRVNERIDVTSATLRGACRGLVREKIEEFARMNGEQEDLISRTIRGGGWEAEGLVEQLPTIIAAGHETSASAFTWTLYLLAQNQSAQERLRSELLDAMPLLSEEPTSDSLANILENLPYLNTVCNETLRFIPPVPLIRRKILAGTQVLLCPYAINHSPDLWGKANNDCGMTSNYAYLTFSHGPRSCIGQSFARAELRTLVAAFVVRFRFQQARPHANVVPVGIVSVRPKDGLYLEIKRVKRAE
ncbi:cytochrome P450 [Aspergillus cavernicola]|uniref:Cytochrome P450 n=1 Tax=Aspergillus cavernicola TaxID=176166 RepID=A0ABR4IS69_9EURO